MPLLSKNSQSKAYLPDRNIEFKKKTHMFSRPISRERKNDPVNSTLETKASMRDSALANSKKPEFIRSTWQLKKTRLGRLNDGTFQTQTNREPKKSLIPIK